MATSQIRIEIDASADDTWEVVGNFGGVQAFVPGIIEVDVENSHTRTLRLEGGGVVREELLGLSAQRRTLTYAITESPFPLKDYTATMSVQPLDDGRCIFAWTATYQPHPGQDEVVADMLHELFDEAANRLRSVVATAA